MTTLYNVTVERHLSGKARWIATGWSQPDRSVTITEVDGHFYETRPTMYSTVGRTKGQARRRLHRFADEHPLDMTRGGVSQ
jgi:hypothetical protein